MAVLTIARRIRAVKKSGVDLISFAHRLWRDHIAEALDRASHDTIDVVFTGNMSALTDAPVHIVPKDMEIASIKVKAGAAGSADSTITFKVGANALLSSVVTIADTALTTGTLAAAQTARAADDVITMTTTVGATPASKVVATIAFKRVKNAM